MISTRILFGLLAIAIPLAGSAHSENAPQALAEKPISLIIGYNPGGSYLFTTPRHFRCLCTQ